MGPGAQRFVQRQIAELVGMASLFVDDVPGPTAVAAILTIDTVLLIGIVEHQTVGMLAIGIRLACGHGVRMSEIVRGRGQFALDAVRMPA
jgi:hypothetical protein